ncbi:MAG: glycosyltransferase family 39 protein, partial [Tepidisphaeraceae bacterium]
MSVLILAFNAVGHDPRVGYDAAAHRAYAGVLAHGRLPSPAESSEFFSAPLSYVPAAALLALRLQEPIVAKLWQLLQVGYAVVLLIYLRRIARALTLTAWGQLATLLTLLGAAVWWRSFALLRPEALLATVVVVAAYHTIRLFQGERALGHFVTAGVLWGLACLSRQWGILAVLGVVAAAGIAPKADRRWWRGVAVSAACCAAVAGPFYAYLHLRFGSVKAFNQSTAPAR